MLIVEIHAETAATHHAVPIGAGESSPDVRQGPCGGRRARFGVITSCCVLNRTEGIIFSKNSVENVAISTPAGNRQRPDHARQAGHRRRRVPPSGRPGVRHDGRRICGWWEHRSCIARAACGRSGCRWVPGLLRARQLGEGAHHAGAAAACSSLEGSLAFAGTGLMVAVAVSAAMAVFAMWALSVQYCKWLAAAQYCPFRCWT